MHYYKYNGKLIPIQIIGIDTDTPLDDCYMKVIVKSDFNINEDIDISKIISINDMYSNKKNVILTESKELKPNDLVLFVDNNAEQKHLNDGNVGWCDEMDSCINKIGMVVENYNDGSYDILFNEYNNWTILTSCLLKISDNIKKL